MEVLRWFNPERTVWVEREAARVGRVQIPHALYKAMRRSPITWVALPLEHRVAYTREQYRHFETAERREALDDALAKLKPLHGSALVRKWNELANGHRWDALVEESLLLYNLIS